MGNLIWHDLGRFISITASVYAVWSSFFGFYYRKFFWDFVGGTLRDPGGIQPAPGAAVFITLIVKAPIIQILAMILGMMIVALEYSLPLVKGLALYRSFVVRIVLLFFQSFLCILYYQVTWVDSTMLASEIISKIPVSYDNGLASGSLFFFPSTVNIHNELGVDFEIRLCPALQKKPRLPTPHFNGGADEPVTEPLANVDPFAPPYDPGLLVGELISEEISQQYVVLMNKYSVVPRHFLLITKEYQSQTSPLMPDDLLQAYALLVAGKKAGKKMFAFYNCGDLSGASQPHKHLQFIETEDEGPPIEVLAGSISLESPGKPFSIERLPWANHVFRFPSNLPSSPVHKREPILADAFISLLDLVISTVRYDPTYPAGLPSYNVILTLEHMHLIPRRFENHTLESTGDDLSVNSMGFAGMLLVKSERELEAVKTEGLGKILRSVALQSVHDLQVAGSTRDIDGDATSML
ncbi:ATP adenylyltransferase-domain-containing protein [Lentinula edodes]|nr:ATP adenylyltransferase-domain-containing protein [Lentinula edodes]KAJ3923915.1 ATP adenylyltransferase-domain-containing protein [Lentinula edodes]